VLDVVTDAGADKVGDAATRRPVLNRSGIDYAAIALGPSTCWHVRDTYMNFYGLTEEDMAE